MIQFRIVTKRFLSDIETRESLDSLLKEVNQFINDKGIKKENILEYATHETQEEYLKYSANPEVRTRYTIVLSYWTEKYISA